MEKIKRRTYRKPKQQVQNGTAQRRLARFIGAQNQMEIAGRLRQRHGLAGEFSIADQIKAIQSHAGHSALAKCAIRDGATSRNRSVMSPALMSLNQGTLP